MQGGDASARRMLMRLLLLLLLLLQSPMQPRRRIDQGLAQPRTAEVRREFPVDLQGAPVVRLPVPVGSREFTLLLGLDRKLRAVALRAKLNIAVRSEPEIVAARDMMQPSIADLEILRCGAQRSHHRADVEVCHAGYSLPDPARLGRLPASNLPTVCGMIWNEHTSRRGVPLFARKREARTPVRGQPWRPSLPRGGDRGTLIEV